MTSKRGLVPGEKNLINELGQNEKKYWMQFYLPHTVQRHQSSKAFGELPGELWKCIILLRSFCSCSRITSCRMASCRITCCGMCESVRVTMLLTVCLLWGLPLPDAHGWTGRKSKKIYKRISLLLYLHMLSWDLINKLNRLQIPFNSRIIYA